MYPNATRFCPARYIYSENQNTIPQPDPAKFVFVFGRRRCSGTSTVIDSLGLFSLCDLGIDLAEMSIFMQVVSILATFNIKKEPDAEKREITPAIDFTGDLVSGPEEFVCRIELRFECVLELIEGSC